MNYTIDILGHTYTKVYSDSVNDSAHVDLSELKIYISVKMEQSRQEEALIHEILEALNYHLGLGLEHRQTVAISEGLYVVLKTNKLLQL